MAEDSVGDGKRVAAILSALAIGVPDHVESVFERAKKYVAAG